MMHIDINCDMGEGLNNEADLMPYISSCNIACGGHAGNESTMREVTRLAKMHHVKIGAHPSFPDRTNFGRKVVAISLKDLKSSIIEQISGLRVILESEQLALHHVKPHGALYNLAAKDRVIAEMITDVVQKIDENLKLYVPYGSVIAEVAQANEVAIIYEAFLDRNYNEDYSLVSRENPEALIEDSDVMFSHLIQMIKTNHLTTVTGKKMPIKANTFCMHGDHENVVENLQKLTNRLRQNNIEVS